MATGGAGCSNQASCHPVKRQNKKSKKPQHRTQPKENRNESRIPRHTKTTPLNSSGLAGLGETHPMQQWLDQKPKEQPFQSFEGAYPTYGPLNPLQWEKEDACSSSLDVNPNSADHSDQIQ